MNVHMDDTGGGGIADDILDVAGAVGGELKKMGKSATSQISGDDVPYVSGAMPSGVPAAPMGDQGSDVGVDQFKKLGQSFLSQLTGKQIEESKQNHLNQMKKKDDDFSAQEAASIRAKINQIYQEHAMRKAQEAKQEEMVEKREEEEKKQIEVQEVKKKDVDIQVAQGKANAEIKNFGAE